MALAQLFTVFVKKKAKVGKCGWFPSKGSVQCQMLRSRDEPFLTS